MTRPSHNQISTSHCLAFTAMRLLMIGLLVLTACAGSFHHEPHSTSAAADNVILLIGDGMGEAHILASRWKSLGINGRLVLETMPYQGRITTHSADDPITDSAASATAMATGVKTNNGCLGIGSDGQRLTSIDDQERITIGAGHYWAG